MVNLELGACFMRSAKQAAHASRSVALSAARLAKVMSPTRLHQFEALHKIYFYDAWRNEPILDREPAAPAQRCYNRCFGCHATFGHWHACYQLWSPNDLDLISSDGQLSLLPSPDSAHGTGFCSPCERQPCFVRTNNLRRLTFVTVQQGKELALHKGCGSVAVRKAAVSSASDCQFPSTRVTQCEKVDGTQLSGRTAAHKDLVKVDDFRRPPCRPRMCITRAGHCHQFQHANLASNCPSGLRRRCMNPS